jgi:hypothetical protein
MPCNCPRCNCPTQVVPVIDKGRFDHHTLTCASEAGCPWPYRPIIVQAA